MKINHRHLSIFARGSATVDRQGYLSKLGEDSKFYQRRWFVLKGNLLFYYGKKNDAEPVGLIILEGCTIERNEDSEKFAFQLVFIGPAVRTYVFSADNQEDMEAWMKAFSCSGYDYIKDAVFVLQCRMNELNTTSTVAVHEDENLLKPNDNDDELALDSSSTQIIVSPNYLVRKNPFDIRRKTDALIVFDDLNLKLDYSVTKTPHSARTFEEMHYMFGDYILPRITL